MNTDSQRFLMKIVEMYYRDEMSQEVIAKKLSISRTTVARYLNKAKEEGYVKITINFPEENSILLEKQLESTYNLKEAIVALPQGEQAIGNIVASCASDYLIRILKNKMVLGVTWGRSMRQVIDCFGKDPRVKNMGLKNVQIVPLLGTSNSMDYNDKEYRLTYSNVLATEIGEIINGISLYLPAPMFVSNQEIKDVIEKEEQVASVLERAKNADIALFGIGPVSEQSSVGKAGLITGSEFKLIREKGGVGETVGRFYDSNGNIADENLDKKTVGVSLEDIQKIPIRIGVAYGKDKLEAIKGALKGGIVNVLVTDNATAQLVLE